MRNQRDVLQTKVTDKAASVTEEEYTHAIPTHTRREPYSDAE